MKNMKMNLLSDYLLSSAKSSIFCFIFSVDCHFLLAVLDRSIAGLRTVLESLPMIILESVKLYRDVKDF